MVDEEHEIDALLTSEEIAVLRQIDAGMSLREIAASRGTTVDEIASDVAATRRRLGVTSTAAALRLLRPRD